MEESLFDAWTRRRFGLATGGVAVSLLGLAAGDGASAKKKKRKKCKNCCSKNGNPCTKKSAKCKAGFCLNTPFTIEANWIVDADHDAILFFPPENETTGPSPFIFFNCSTTISTCDEEYPFACFSGDETTSGSEIATIFQLLPGKYEYWNEIDLDTLAGELEIVLKDSGGRVVRRWLNPANPGSENGWHVFDIDGSTGVITSIDELITGGLPENAHDPSTNVCPEL